MLRKHGGVTDSNRWMLALGAAIAFTLVAIINAFMWFTAHGQVNAIFAVAFGVPALLWVAVCVRFKRREAQDRLE